MKDQYNLVSKRRVFNLLDRIENIEKKMVHEIPTIKDSLKKWQDGELKDSYFINKLTKYLDLINDR